MTVLVLLATPSLPRVVGAERVLLDPAYPRRGKQSQHVSRQVDRVRSPTITFPALVRAGETFGVVVTDRIGPDGKPLLPRDPSHWLVYLQAGPGALARRCAVESVDAQGSRRLGLRVRVPQDLARDVYDLRIVARGLDDRQSNSVRVLGRTEHGGRFRFVVMADHQLWDPSFKVTGRPLNADTFPRPKEKLNDNELITRQGLSEVALLDPDFVIHAGDLIFGLDYQKEYDEAHQLLRQARLPVFAVPGNHDGYAIYTVRLRGNPLTLIGGALRCRRHVAGDLDWNKVWTYITCVYGDVKDLLYADLHRDGLIHWRRQLGPTDYAFDHGELHFVAINTYGGSARRRHAFSFYMDAFDLHLGAPAVDNYGGFLTAEQLRFVEQQARRATARGRTLVLIGHHDPRGGSRDGKRYHPNESFPSDPVSLGGFEEWNFETKEWDSDPDDARGPESEAQNSATALLRILARHGGYYLCGHAHHDGRQRYAVGSKLGRWRVERPVEFIRTTTAASSVRQRGSYWGYRLIEVRGRRLAEVDFSEAHELGSIPVGNLWARPIDERTYELGNGLPRAVRVVLRWALPVRPEGFRFRIHPAPDGPTALDPRQRVNVLRIAEQARQRLYWLEVMLPAAEFPPTARRLQRERVRALVARDNQAPEPAISVAPGAGPPLVQEEGRLLVEVGQPLLLSAGGSADAEGDRILQYRWEIDEGLVRMGERLSHTFTVVGDHLLRLTLVDEAGARKTASQRVLVRTPPPPPAPKPPGCRGCCTPSVILPGGGLGALFVALVWLFWRRRRRGNRASDDDA